MREIERKRPIDLKQHYRSGDVLEVETYHSLSEKKLNSYRGVLMGTKRKGSLNRSFRMATVVADTEVMMLFKEYSPKLKNARIVKYGPNKQRNMLNHLKSEEYGARNLTEPVLRGRSTTPRERSSRRPRPAKGGMSNFGRKNSIQLQEKLS